MNRLLLLALAASVSLPPSASAQTIVMRKILTSRLPSTSPDAVGKAEWRITDWRWENPSLTCSDAARQVRNVSCLTKSGTAVDPSRCGTEVPEKSQILQRYDGCVTAWKTDDAWSPFSSTCSDAATRTRKVQCLRSGGDTATKVMDPSACPGAMPASSETQGVYTGCTKAWDVGTGWSDWSSSCSNAATHTRTVQCLRTGGDAKPAAVSSSECSGTKPIDTETQGVYSGCAHTWSPVYGPWIGACGEPRTRTISYDCYRDGIGGGKTLVEKSFCTAPLPPQKEDGAPIPCVNLLPGGDVEGTFNAWSPLGRSQDDPHGGKYYGQGYNGQYGRVTAEGLVVGKTYVFSVWTRAYSGCPGAQIVLQHNYGRNLPFSCSKTWTKAVMIFKAEITGATVVIGGGEVKFDDVSIVEQ